MTAPTGRPSEIRNLAPAAPPRPEIEHESNQLFIIVKEISKELCIDDSLVYY